MPFHEAEPKMEKICQRERAERLVFRLPVQNEELLKERLEGQEDI
jgi:hypothetical protein